MIKPIPSDNNNEFYLDKNINELVDLALDNINEDLFLYILNLIQHRNLDFVNILIEKYKLKSGKSQYCTYDSLSRIFNDIYRQS